MPKTCKLFPEEKMHKMCKPVPEEKMHMTALPEQGEHRNGFRKYGRKKCRAQPCCKCGAFMRKRA